MEAARLTGVEAARRLSWSPSWVSRMLSGKRGASEVALDEGHSRDLIAAVAQGLSADLEDGS